MSKSSLFRNALFSVAYRLMQILFPMISLGYVARILTPDGVGRNADVQNNVSYFVMLASLGIQAYAVRETAKRKDDKKAADELFSEMIVINAVLTILSITVFMICLNLVDVFRNEFVLYAIYGFMIFVNFINVDWYYQGTEEFKFIAVRSFIVKSMMLIAVFLFVHEAGDVYVYAVINLISYASYHIINIIYTGRTVTFRIRGLNLKRHLRSLVFLALCTVSTELYARMDITMLGVMENKSTVAYYTYSQKIVNMIVITAIAITAVFLPRLSYYYSHDKVKFNKLAKTGADLMILISIPACLGLVSISYPLISVWLGPDYMEAAPCLMVLAFMIPLKCIGDLVCYQVMMCAGQEFFLMISYTLTMIINFINNIILIPRYGALGASIASVISEVLVFIFVLFFSRKHQNYSIDRKNLLVAASASLVMLLGIALLEKVLSTAPVKLIACSLMGVALFVTANVLAGNTFLTKDLIKMIKDSKSA